jgi:hypothetical protein
LTVLLVVQVEPSCVRLQEGCQRRGVQENVAVFEKADITSSKLYCPCAGEIVGIVYLPGRRRKKSAMVRRSAMACAFGVRLVQ